MLKICTYRYKITVTFSTQQEHSIHMHAKHSLHCWISALQRTLVARKRAPGLQSCDPGSKSSLHHPREFWKLHRSLDSVPVVSQCHHGIPNTAKPVMRNPKLQTLHISTHGHGIQLTCIERSVINVRVLTHEDHSVDRKLSILRSLFGALSLGMEPLHYITRQTDTF